MIEILFFLSTMLLAYAAYEDYKNREFEMVAFIFIIILSGVIFFINPSLYTQEDVMVIVLFLIISLALIFLKQIGEGDLSVIVLALLAPYNFAITLVISCLLIIPILQYSEKLFGKPIIRLPIPFLTVIFIMFILVTLQIYINTGDLFWHTCLDLSKNTDEYKCTFLASFYNEYELPGQDNIFDNAELVLPN